jgi:tetratricopeptide (TPR) repeat protein
MNRILKLALASTLAAATLTGCAEYVTHSDAARAKGLALYDKQLYVDAAGSFQNATKQNPRDYRSHYHLGQSYDQLNQNQQAIKSHKAALDIRPTVPAGIYDNEYRELILDGYARSVSRSLDVPYELKLLEVQAAVATEPDVFIVLARVHKLTGDADAAINTYQRAVDKFPRSFYANKEAGLYFNQLGLREKAIPPLQTANRLNPLDKEVAAALNQ